MTDPIRPKAQRSAPLGQDPWAARWLASQLPKPDAARVARRLPPEYPQRTIGPQAPPSQRGYTMAPAGRSAVQGAGKAVGGLLSSLRDPEVLAGFIPGADVVMDARDLVSAHRAGDSDGVALATASLLLPGSLGAGKRAAGAAKHLESRAGKVGFREVHPEEFHTALGRKIELDPDKEGFFTQRTPEQMLEQKMRTFLTEDGKAGYALGKNEDGRMDIRNVFNAGGPKGAGAAAVAHAVENGGEVLDAFDGTGLTDIYRNLGFAEEYRLPWNDEYRPKGWDDKWERPDVIGMKFAGPSKRADDILASYTPPTRRRAKLVPDPVLAQSGYEMVDLDPQKADAAFQRETGQYIGPGGSGNTIRDRYARAQQFFETSPEMRVGGGSITPDGRMQFIDGRHRFAMLRDQGLERLPVMLDPESAANARSLGIASAPPNAEPGLFNIGPEKGRRKYGSLFDYNALGRDLAPVEQRDVRRWVPASGQGYNTYWDNVDRTLESLNSPENMRRFEEGLKHDGDLWYYMDPLSFAFQDRLGEKEGLKQFNRFMDTIASTSPNSEFGVNMRRAMALSPLTREGVDLTGTNINSLLGSRLGNTAHNNYASSLGRSVRGEEFLAATPLKIDGFGQNLRGNFEPGTADRWHARFSGLDKDTMTPAEYLGVEDATKEWGRQLQRRGLLDVPDGRSVTAPSQSTPWIGEAVMGGVMSSPAPALSVFEDEIRRAGEQLGISPTRALDQFIDGRLWNAGGLLPRNQQKVKNLLWGR